jgi:hypothetical protein
MGQDLAAVALTERCARAEWLERMDVVHLAFHACFDRRQYLPREEDARSPRSRVASLLQNDVQGRWEEQTMWRWWLGALSACCCAR